MSRPRASNEPPVRRELPPKATNQLIASFLGLNAWAQLLLVPLALRADTEWTMQDVLMCCAPLACLGLGIWRRRDWLLLWGFPLCLLAPLVAMPDVIALARFPALRLAASCASLVIYALSVAWVAAAAQPAAGGIVSTRLENHRRPPRWARRERMFLALTGVTAILPIALLGHVLYDATLLARLEELYGARHRIMQILLGLGALIAWLGIVWWAVIGVLDRHRVGDPALLERIDALGQRAALRPGFVVAIAGGVAAVAAISMLR